MPLWTLRRHLKTLADQPRRFRNQLRDEDIIAALQCHNDLTEEALPHTILVDCRCFRDPERQDNGVAHLGLHPSLQTSVACHGDFPLWLGNLRQACHDAIARQDQTQEALPHLNLVFYCNHGRRRSLACMMLMRLVAPRAGWRLGSVRHLGHWDVGRTCHACDECRGAGFDGDREWLSKQMIARWQGELPTGPLR